MHRTFICQGQRPISTSIDSRFVKGNEDDSATEKDSDGNFEFVLGEGVFYGSAISATSQVMTVNRLILNAYVRIQWTVPTVCARTKDEPEPHLV